MNTRISEIMLRARNDLKYYRLLKEGKVEDTKDWLRRYLNQYKAIINSYKNKKVVSGSLKKEERESIDSLVSEIRKEIRTLL